MKKFFLYFVTGLIFGIAGVTGSTLSGRDDVWMNLNIQGNFEPGQKIEAGISGRNITGTAKLKLLKVDLEEVISQSSKNGYAGYLNDLKLKNVETVKEWKVKIKQKDPDEYWTQKELNIDNPGVGTYLLQAEINDAVSVRMFLVTGIAAVMKGDEKQLYVYTADRRTGKPAPGAKVKVFKKSDSSWNTADSDEKGLTKFAGAFDGDAPILVFWKGNPAVMNAYFYGLNDYERIKVYSYTDRPVYRPGQTVRIRGIVRSTENVGYSIPKIKDLKVIIRDPRGNELSKFTASLSEYGSYSSEFKIGDELPLGWYNIITSIDGQEFYSNFSVEEYRKPEYEISVTSDRDAYVQGDELKFNLKAAYYFGEPVKNAEVRYTIYRRPIYWYWWESDDFAWYYRSSSRYQPDYGYYGDHVANGGGRTDDKGMMTIEFDDTYEDQDMQYMVVARVTDQGRKEVSGTGSARVMRGRFKLTVRTDRYMCEPGEKTWIIARTTDLNEQPVSQVLDLLIKRVEWHPNGKTEEKKVVSKKIETSSAGEARIDFTPDETGSYQIELSGKDDRGNTISANAYMYVTKPGQNYWGYYSGGGVELTLDKDRYAIGDEARLLVRSQLGDIPALVTLEGDKLLKAEMIGLKNGSALYTFKITREFQPNTNVAFTAIKDNQLIQSEKTIIAPPDDKFLSITIESDKNIYQPGELARVKVCAKDKNGEPADTELSLGVVDESIYAVKPEGTQDIRSFFYGLRRIRVSTQSSFWFYSYGNDAVQAAAETAAPMAVMEASMDGIGGGRMAKAKSAEMVEPAVIRSDFPDTAYWRAQVETGPDGVAETQITMPDSLTTWRLTSRGITRDTSVGETTYKVIARKNVIVRLETPRFFTQGDEMNITAVVHNYLSEDKDVEAVLNVKGLRLLEGNKKELTVPAGGDVRVEWRAVVEGPQSAWVTVKALTNEESDAMQLTIPVLPHGSPGGDAAAGQVFDKSQFSLKLPEKTVKGTEMLTLTIAPSLTSGMFDVFEYLAGYPYGCVEQTMSRFLPDVVIAQALQKAGRPLQGKLAELPNMVKEGLDRLSGMQHGDGGWGWWKDDETNPYMTAYVVFGLTMAHVADFGVPDDMLSRGVESLKNQFDKTDDPNTLSYMLFALAEAGVKSDKRLDKVYKMRSKLSDYGKATLAIACAKQGDRKCASTLAADLTRSAVVSKTSAHWESKTFHYSWMDNPVESTAFVLMALIEADPQNQLISKALRYLNITRRGDHWYSTKDTAAAVMAQTRYMQKFEEAHPDYEFTVSVNGKVVETRRVTDADLTGPGIKIENIEPAAGTNNVVIEKKGKGNLYYYAAVNYYEKADVLKWNDNGIRVERWFTWDAEGKKRIHPTTKLKSGDRIWAQIKVAPRTVYDYVMIENYLPSGFEVDKTAWNHGDYYYYYRYWSNRELRDEKTVFFIGRVWNNEYRTAVPLRAEMPGKVSAMPCVATLMYFPEVGGRSDEARFTVEP